MRSSVCVQPDFGGQRSRCERALSARHRFTCCCCAIAAVGGRPRDFADLWSTGTIGNSGAFDPAPVQLTYTGTPASVQVFFSPGRGPVIDVDVAQVVARARHRVRVCSMLLNSSALLAALSDMLRCRSGVEVSGIYDRTQMQDVLVQWRDVPHNHWKIGAVRRRPLPLCGSDGSRRNSEV